VSRHGSPVGGHWTLGVVLWFVGTGSLFIGIALAASDLVGIGFLVVAAGAALIAAGVALCVRAGRSVVPQPTRWGADGTSPSERIGQTQR
jgi:hypothetical protein